MTPGPPRRRRLALPAALVAAGTAGAVVAVAVRGGTAVAAAPAAPPVTTATVVRTDLTTTMLTGGTLGYAPSPPVINQLTGTYTWLPAAGATIRAGQALYRVDDVPVTLMAGRTPAWRPFGLGMTGGSDVTELQASLIARGDARGLFSVPTGQFDWLTAAAVERWQAASGYPVTGQIALGQVVFLPAPILTGAPDAAAGQGAVPGSAPYAVTTTRRTVIVPLNPNIPAISPGEAVSLILPSGTATPGRVITVGSALAPAPAAGSSGSGGSAGSGGSGAAPAGSTVAVVAPGRPGATGTGADVPIQVSLTVRSVRGVLAVPVSALLALAGGGYAVEVAGRSGTHHLTGVTTGAFAGGRVQISGPGIAAGAKVVVAQ